MENKIVTFNKGDGTILTGRVVRVWAKSIRATVTIKTIGTNQTYVRFVDRLYTVR